MMDLKIKPHDTLFFRDAKPMSAGEGYGNGCNMPMPNLVYSAFRTAIIRNEDQLPHMKMVSHHTRDKAKYGQRRIGLDKYGSLFVRSVFPMIEGCGVLFPIPKDVLRADKNGARKSVLGKVSGQIIPLATVPPSKERVSGFWSASQLSAYCINNIQTDMTPIPVKEVWQQEWRIGVEINPERSANESGQLFAGEYMRMTENAAFVADVTLDEEDLLEKVDTVALGGDRRLCEVSCEKSFLPTWEVPSVNTDGEYLVKWILLTPSIFANGSKPGWIVDGKVRLQPEINGEKVAISAELLSAIVGDPVPVSGWDVLEGVAKPSLLSVAAGAVYYFRCDTKEDANNLAKALHAKNRSDLHATKGFGFGITTIEEFKLINH